LKLTENPNPLAIISNKTIDYFTFEERLNTNSKGNNFYDWFNNPFIKLRPSFINFIQKKLIKSLNTDMNKLLYNHFCLYNKTINAFKLNINLLYLKIFIIKY
jgi:hypothetical protein